MSEPAARVMAAGRAGRRAWWALAWALACAPSLGQGIERVLVDGQLRSRTVTVTSVGAGGVSYVDDAGRPGTARAGEVVALLPVREEGDPERRSRRVNNDGLLELVDGQRFPGERAAPAAEDGEEAFAWRSPTFGRLVTPLDRVSRAALTAEARRGLVARGPAPSGGDVFVLANGDRLSGFVVSLGEPMAMEVRGGGVVEAPGERVALVEMSNPREALSGFVVWLEDGSVVRAASVETDPTDAVALGLSGGQTARVSLAGVRAVVFDAGRVAGLSGLKPASESAVGERELVDGVRSRDEGWWPAAGGLADVELPGPMRVSWALPTGAARFAAEVRLAPGAAPWGDCEVVALVDGEERWRARLHGERARETVNLALGEGAERLEIVVEPGRYGPINDRVTLVRPTLLLGRPGG